MPQVVSQRFSIHPEPGRKRFYRILIFTERRYMQAVAEQVVKRMGLKDPNASKTHARCCTWGRPRRRDGYSGLVMFYEGNCRVGTVSHEMVHVAAGYLWQDKVRFSHRTEERFAQIVDRCCRQFYTKFWRVKRTPSGRRRQ